MSRRNGRLDVQNYIDECEELFPHFHVATDTGDSFAVRAVRTLDSNPVVYDSCDDLDAMKRALEVGALCLCAYTGRWMFVHVDPVLVIRYWGSLHEAQLSRVRVAAMESLLQPVDGSFSE